MAPRKRSNSGKSTLLAIYRRLHVAEGTSLLQLITAQQGHWLHTGPADVVVATREQHKTSGSSFIVALEDGFHPPPSSRATINVSGAPPFVSGIRGTFFYLIHCLDLWHFGIGARCAGLEKRMMWLLESSEFRMFGLLTRLEI